jgi:hypothetical protein
LEANQPQDRRKAVDLAATIHRHLERMKVGVDDKIRALDVEIGDIRALSTTSEEAQREAVLAPTQAHLEQSRQILERTKREAGLAGWGAPWQTLQCIRAVKKAEVAHDDAIRRFEEPETSRIRSEKIGQHNAHVQSERGRLGELKASVETHRRASEARGGFAAAIADVHKAASADGWLVDGLVATLEAIAQHLKEGKLVDASQRLPALQFQRKPPPQQYVAWCREAQEALAEAFQNVAGFAASGAYSDIAARSIALARPALGNHALSRLDQEIHVADAWQTLAIELTEPQSLLCDVQWALYWSMFQACQTLAGSLDQGSAREDIFTGEISAEFHHWLSKWASKRIEQLGYPVAPSYFGTFKIAGSLEETRLGADLGIVVDIQAGSLHCKKVVLLQAKKVMDGKANIGSKSSQLALLSARQKLGFYLLYHQSTFPKRPPAPTVCRASDLATLVQGDGRGLSDEYLPVSTRDVGWDWAHFFAFGLCDTSSSIGETFDSIDDAMSLLGEGNAGHLPKHLFIVAITDGARVRALREKVRQRYHEQTNDKSRDRVAGHRRPPPTQGRSHRP